MQECIITRKDLRQDQNHQWGDMEIQNSRWPGDRTWNTHTKLTTSTWSSLLPAIATALGAPKQVSKWNI